MAALITVKALEGAQLNPINVQLRHKASTDCHEIGFKTPLKEPDVNANQCMMCDECNLMHARDWIDLLACVDRCSRYHACIEANVLAALDVILT